MLNWVPEMCILSQHDGLSSSLGAFSSLQSLLNEPVQNVYGSIDPSEDRSILPYSAISRIVVVLWGSISLEGD